MNTLFDDVPDEPPVGPPAVSRFEYNLLRIARFLLGHMPPDQGIQLVLTANPTPPPCLSTSCLRLLRDTFGKAMIPFLVRTGGWRRDKFLHGDKPQQGRVWERRPVAERALTFSKNSVAFLMWLTIEKPIETKNLFTLPPDEMTAGDELFFLLALDALRAEPRTQASLVGLNCFSANPLCRLVAPGDFCELDVPLPDFAPSFLPPRVAVLECLQPLLAARWTLSERAKGQIADWQRLRRLGQAEEAVLAAFLAAADRANRKDLSRFLLKANYGLTIASDPQADGWIGGLQGEGPPRMAERLDTHRAALAVPRQLLTLQRWERQARTVGFFDDDYQAAQMYKSEWEAANGDLMSSRARTILDSVEPLR